MKNALCAFIIFAGTLPLRAQAPAEHREGPCIKIMEACKAAGFKGTSAGGVKKSLSKDCMQPLLSGQQVAGVHLDAADIAACKAKKAQLKVKK